MTVVENLSQQNSVKSWISAQDILGLDWSLDTVFIACLDDELWSGLLILVPVSFVKMIADILQNMTIAIAVNKVFSKVGHFFVSSILGNMIVDPSNQNFFISEF